MALILIVDDSKMTRELLKEYLAEDGHDILDADGGKRAIEIFEDRNPDFVFLDIKMADMDGFMVLEKIKEINPKAKVLMCSSLIGPEEEKYAKELGALGYIRKPFSSDEVKTVLGKYL